MACRINQGGGDSLSKFDPKQLATFPVNNNPSKGYMGYKVNIHQMYIPYMGEQRVLVL